MLLVIETREDLAPIPVDPTPRSTERALRAMGWPFPIDTAPAPRRPLPVAAKPNNVVALPVPAPAATPVPAAMPEPRRVARVSVPLFALAEAR